MLITTMKNNSNKSRTSSLNSLLYSFSIGSTSWIWPRVKPTISISLSDLAVNWLKSWQVGDGPRYVFFSTGRVKSAAFATKHTKYHFTLWTKSRALINKHTGPVNLRDYRHTHLLTQVYVSMMHQSETLLTDCLKAFKRQSAVISAWLFLKQ